MVVKIDFYPSFHSLSTYLFTVFLSKTGLRSDVLAYMYSPFQWLKAGRRVKPSFGDPKLPFIPLVGVQNHVF